MVAIALILYPLAVGLSRSLYEVNRYTLGATWVGLSNFKDELFGPTASFPESLRLSVIFAVGTTALQVVLGVAVALMLNKRFWGRSLARALVMFPYMVPIIVAVLVWKWMLEDQRGIIDHGLQSVGLIDEPIVWFGEDLSMLSVIIISAWRSFPFIALVVLARLQSIPSSLYEAARTDGASSWSQFWDVTVPQIRTVLAATVTLRLIWEFNDFDLIALTTGGGPAKATETLPLAIFHQTFLGAGIGRGSALAVLSLLIVMSCVIVIVASTWPRRGEEATR